MIALMLVWFESRVTNYVHSDRYTEPAGAYFVKTKGKVFRVVVR